MLYKSWHYSSFFRFQTPKVIALIQQKMQSPQLPINAFQTCLRHLLPHFNWINQSVSHFSNSCKRKCLIPFIKLINLSHYIKWMGSNNDLLVFLYQSKTNRKWLFYQQEITNIHHHLNLHSMLRLQRLTTYLHPWGMSSII